MKVEKIKESKSIPIKRQNPPQELTESPPIDDDLADDAQRQSQHHPKHCEYMQD